MIPTNPFVEQNKQRINRFLNDLCEVGDFYESLEMDQYMALSKKDIVLNITLNEMYNTHALLQQHVDVLSPKKDDHLRILLTEAGQAPAQVPRKQNLPIVLPLFSRWETPIQGKYWSLSISWDLLSHLTLELSVIDLTTALMSENNITQNDIQYMEAKAIFVQLVRSLPYFAKKVLDLHRIAEAAATSKDAQMVRKGIKVQDMLKELEEANVIDRKDNYALLVQEIKQELVHLGDLKDRVMQESGSLESVYKTILDHNNYLKSQLESYKAYLQNVRIQSGGGEKASKKSVGIGVEVEHSGKSSKSKSSKPQVLGPYKFTHQQLEKDGVIAVTNVPDSRQVLIWSRWSPWTDTNLCVNDK